MMIRPKAQVMKIVVVKKKIIVDQEVVLEVGAGLEMARGMVQEMDQDLVVVLDQVRALGLEVAQKIKY